MYQLTVGNNKLKFETKEHGVKALVSKWYYDRFPYRWHTDMWGNTLISDDWIGEFNHRCETLLPRLNDELTKNGFVTFGGLKLEQVED